MCNSIIDKKGFSNQVKYLVLSGLSMSYVARIIGLHPVTVMNWCKKNNIKATLPVFYRDLCCYEKQKAVIELLEKALK